VRAASGIGSVLAEVAGNNTSAAFSEDDMLRERLAENVGTAGDSEVMSLNANSRVVVSVPADTRSMSCSLSTNKHPPSPTRQPHGSVNSATHTLRFSPWSERQGIFVYGDLVPRTSCRAR